ncbi:hypothetical protein DPMN_153395 [Dreissena polymorpha]|uniref:Uncharacterized protein n=1 Tax=Dreissena polymorpha TaxID=45954 RepID=A0A9D4FIK2_DREPO|nr:hypothetical protein DPMN_153395 [Dreissena polymorpha]
MSNNLTDDQKMIKKSKSVSGHVVPNIPIYSTFSSTSQLIDVAKQLKSSNVRVSMYVTTIHAIHICRVHTGLRGSKTVMKKFTLTLLV